MPSRIKLPDLEDTTWAYLAGLVDGEGTITIHRRRASRIKERLEYVAVLSVAQKKRTILDWIKETTGVGTIVLQKYADPRHYCHTWILSSNIAYEFIKAMQPYLRIKAEQARIVIAFQEAKREWMGGKQGGRKELGVRGTIPTPPELILRYQGYVAAVQELNRHTREKVEILDP